VKIICKDNFDRDYKSDSLVCENVNKYYGKYLVDFLNEKFSGEDSEDFYILADDSYELFIWEP
jgi:hypothetical protein